MHSEFRLSTNFAVYDHLHFETKLTLLYHHMPSAFSTLVLTFRFGFAADNGRNEILPDESDEVWVAYSKKHQKPEKSLFMRTWWCNKLKTYIPDSEAPCFYLFVIHL
jgi:hypothetical protein